MKQMTFADAEYAGKRKQTRKELFLIEMDQVVPWKGLIALIEPHYPKGDGGRPAYPLMAMVRQFAGLSLERIPDETTILNFRRLLEKHELATDILGVINSYLGDRGLSLRQGTIVNATLILAPSSTKNKDVVCADAGYTGVEKGSEHDGRQIIWQIAARRSTYKNHGKRSALYKAIRKIEKAKAQVRARVEHPFRVIKRQFGYTKVRFRGLVKNTAQLVTLFALSNLWVARRHLLTHAGEMRL